MDAADRYDSLFQFYGGADWWKNKIQLQAESSLDPDALSRAGAQGLAQFMPRTWAEWQDGTPGIDTPPAGLIDPRDPEDAIRAQAAYMKWLQGRFDDYWQAVAAYNAGPTAVRKVAHLTDWLTHLPQETQHYVERIKQAIDAYLEQ